MIRGGKKGACTLMSRNFNDWFFKNEGSFNNTVSEIDILNQYDAYLSDREDYLHDEQKDRELDDQGDTDEQIIS